jgi:hypothetical protein
MKLTDQQIRTLRIAFKTAGRHGDAMLCSAALAPGPAANNARRMLSEIAEPILKLAEKIS